MVQDARNIWRTESGVPGTLFLMRIVRAIAVAALAVVVATPSEGAGVRRVWRGYSPIGAISRNVITPWYVGYYGSHYSYYRPDPVSLGVRYAAPATCWAWDYYGDRVYVC